MVSLRSEGEKEGGAPEAARSSSKRKGGEKQERPAKSQKAGLFAFGFKVTAADAQSRSGRDQSRSGRVTSWSRQHCTGREHDGTGRSRKDPLADTATPVARFQEEWDCLERMADESG